MIDIKLSCKVNTTEVNKRLKAYFTKKKLLLKKHFNPKSLIRIFQYFQKSRLFYGMSAFADLQTPIKKVQTVFLSHLKSVLRVPISTCNKRLLLTLGLNSLTASIKVGLLKNYFKFIKTFGYEPTLYRDTLRNTFGAKKLNSFELPNVIRDYRRKEFEDMANEKGITLAEDYIPRLKKEMYPYPDKGDYLLITLISNIGFFSHRHRVICQHCGEENGRDHAVNSCDHYSDWRDRNEHPLRAHSGPESDGMTMEKLLEFGFYAGSKDIKLWRKAMKKIKASITELYFDQVKIENECR
jgi:hypothetical protein